MEKNTHLQFLGCEFLTWLYFQIQDTDGELSLANKDLLRLVLGRRVLLEPIATDQVKVALASPRLDDSAELLSAIKDGSMIKSLALEVHFTDRVYTFTLNALDASIVGFKSKQNFQEEGPKAQEEDDVPHDVLEEESVLLRMSALDELDQMLDELYARFIARRLASDFVAKDIHAMRKSVVDGLKSRLGGESKVASENYLSA